MDITELLTTVWNAAQDGPLDIFLIMVAVIAILCALRDKEGALVSIGILFILLGAIFSANHLGELLVSWFPQVTTTLTKIVNIMQNGLLDKFLIVVGILALLRALRNKAGYLIIFGFLLIFSAIGLSIQTGLSKTLPVIMILMKTGDLLRIVDLAHKAPLPTFLIVVGFTAIIWALRNKTKILITAAILLIIVTTIGMVHS